MSRLLGAAAAVAALFAAATVAFAHAEPARVRPGDGAVLNVPPLQVDIQMTQDMARQAGGNDIVVVDASGKKVTTAAATIDNADRRRLTVPLPANLATGTYTVQWKTLSADDGDPANGTTSFTYDPSAAPSPGKEVLQADLIGAAPTAATTIGGEQGSSTSWVLLVAVAVAALTIGAGGVYLLLPGDQ